jgi:hypothetical protein
MFGLSLYVLKQISTSHPQHDWALGQYFHTQMCLKLSYTSI